VNTLLFNILTPLKNVTDIPLSMNSVLKKYGSYYSCSSNGKSHIDLVTMKDTFEVLYCINIAPVPTVLGIDVPTQMEPSFIREKLSFGSRTPL
jgi:hypothetical protein